MRFGHIVFIVLAWILLFTSVYAEVKRYEIKSGKVEYTVRGDGQIMGMKMSTKGTYSIVFKEWGKVEVTKGVTESTIPMQGTQVENEWSKFDNGKIFWVDEEEKVIVTADMASGMFEQDGKNFTKMGREMLEQNGGKLIGHEKLMGYKCEVWQWGNESKIWIHKGIMLKSEVSMMGITTVEEAIKVDFNVKTTSSDFALPNYPVKTMEEAYGQMDGDLSPEEKALMQEMLKGLGSMGQ